MASTSHHHHSYEHPIVVVTIDDEAFGHCCWVPSDHLQEHLTKVIVTPEDRRQIQELLASILSEHLLRQMEQICDANAAIELLSLELKRLLGDGKSELTDADAFIAKLLGEQEHQPALW